MPPHGGNFRSHPPPPVPPHAPTPSSGSRAPPPPNPPTGGSPLGTYAQPPHTPGFPYGAVHHVLVQDAHKAGWRSKAGKPFENHWGPAFFQELRAYVQQVGSGLRKAHSDPNQHGPPLTRDGAVGVITTRLELTHQGLKNDEVARQQALIDFTEQLKKPEPSDFRLAQLPFIKGEILGPSDEWLRTLFGPLQQRGHLVHHHSWSQRYLFRGDESVGRPEWCRFLRERRGCVGYTLTVTESNTAMGRDLRYSRSALTIHDGEPGGVLHSIPARPHSARTAHAGRAHGVSSHRYPRPGAHALHAGLLFDADGTPRP